MILSLGATARVKHTRFTVLVKHEDAVDCIDQEVARRTITAHFARLHGVIDFLHAGKSARDASRGKKTVCNGPKSCYLIYRYVQKELVEEKTIVSIVAMIRARSILRIQGNIGLRCRRRTKCSIKAQR